MITSQQYADEVAGLTDPLPLRFTMTDVALDKDQPRVMFTDTETGRSVVTFLYAASEVRHALYELFSDETPAALPLPTVAPAEVPPAEAETEAVAVTESAQS